MAVINIKAQVDEAVKEYLHETSQQIKTEIDDRTKDYISDFYHGYSPKRHVRHDRLKKLLHIKVDTHHKRKRDIILDADANRLGNNYPSWVTADHIYEWSFMEGGHGWEFNNRRAIMRNYDPWEALRQSLYKRANTKKSNRSGNAKGNRLILGGGVPYERIESLLGTLHTGKGSALYSPNRFQRKIEDTILNPAMIKLNEKLDNIIENIWQSVLS